MKILMTGATGLIGKELGKALVGRGYEVFVVTRDVAKARSQLPFPCEIIEGQLTEGPLTHYQSLPPMDVVINLAGENIGGGRWNESRKRKIYESRILGTRHLIQSLPVAPKVFISASAIGYYGSQGDTVLTEDSPPGDDFLAQVCQDWEEELLTFSYGEVMTATRVVSIRTGMVLSSQGGAMDRLLPLYRRGLGSILGDGKQWMSWIHIADQVGLILHALEKNSLRGPINLVSPNPVTNEEFSKTLASVLDVRLGPRVPAMVLWASMGEMANLVLNSQRVLPQVATQTGYKFKYPELKAALEQVCNREEQEVFISEQYLPWKPEQVFPFFSHAGNLQKITPSSLNFEILSGSPGQIQQGSEIVYRLKLHGVPMKWRTRIEDWNPPHQFTDTQIEGPYTVWRHTHEFRPFAGGTLMVDRIHYILPMGAFGSLLGGSFVRAELERVFAYRREYLIKNLERDLGFAPQSSLHL
jgi:uncharacterized protein